MINEQSTFFFEVMEAERRLKLLLKATVCNVLLNMQCAGME